MFRIPHPRRCLEVQQNVTNARLGCPSVQKPICGMF
jgi:hypothetical protein